MTTRTLVLRGAAVVVSVALLAWLVLDARWQGVGTRLARIDVGSLAGVALLFAASYAMRGARIHGEFRDELGHAGSAGGRYLRILRLSLVHNALVNVLPFRSGEAAFPVLLSRWFGIGSARAVVSLLWLRAQDACVVMTLAALAWPGLAWAWRVACLVAIALLAAGVPWWARRYARQDADASRIARWRALLARATRGGLAGWLWTLGNWLVKLVAEAWLLALALAMPPTGAPVLGAIGAELASILPVQGVAGFGTFEAGAAALMRTQDVAMAAGLEAALVLHAVVLALSLAGGGLAAIFLPGAPTDAR